MTYQEYVDKLQEIADRLKKAIGNAAIDNLDMDISIQPIYQIGLETEYVYNVYKPKLIDMTQAVSSDTIKKHRETIEDILGDLCAALDMAQKDHFAFEISNHIFGAEIKPAESRLSFW